ncbi:MAG: phytanoyl-CoA dioxygenase family protein [Chloroflexota bacterium]
MKTPQQKIAEPYTITQDQIDQFQADGYIKLKEVLSQDVLDYYGEHITGQVIVRNKQNTPIEERNTYAKAFLQITNLWEEDDMVKEFCLSSRLGQIATQLMRVNGVRLYHDQALYKEPGGGFTPWHADQFYWPLTSNHSVTAWIPLQAVPLEMGPLSFCVGSQRILQYRDLAISDESEEKIERSLKRYPKDVSAYDLGEISFHAGWTFHRAGPNQTDQMRSVMTIIYIDKDMIVAEPQNSSQESDLNRWFPGAKPGGIADTPLNPVVYSDNR